MNQIYLTLPMPPSINAMHGYGNKIGRKRAPGVFRSSEYNDWIALAGIEWRRQSNFGSLVMLQGRLRAQYIFVFTSDRDQDVNNREKCLSDFLQDKIFKNDAQIDESFHYRRIQVGCKQRVGCWITEIADNRYEESCVPELAA